jgi:hypothetical protein
LAKSSKTAPTERAPNRKAIECVRIAPEERVMLYAQSRYLPSEFCRKAALQLPFTAYYQDPFVAQQDPDKGLNEKLYVAWEPGLSDGPTSSRFAIVDFNADTGKLEPAAVWDDEQQTFVGPDGKGLTTDGANKMQFHQVSVWALLQRALDFFEDGSALGRSISWAFEGNRLVVVPHAGYGQNAYYDRESKSLQFYYFNNDEDKTVFTCLSVDIVNHEFGHAVLDGVRPLFNESSNVQTAAFHEFMGDLSAILLTLQNRDLRGMLAESSGGKFEKAKTLSSIAEEFGRAVEGLPYLRTALNTFTMADMKDETRPHTLSQVMTGAMFDVLIAIGESYRKNSKSRKPKTPKEAFWYAFDRMQRMAVQPLDLLPPAEVTFRDYAIAVCRSQQIADPIDPEKYYGKLIAAFRKRGILSKEDVAELTEPAYLYKRLDLAVHHSIDGISRSRASAYRFLDDNREHLLIPANRDFFVADLYGARKFRRQNLPMPRQIVLQYAWREEVELKGARFGQFDGRTTTMLCGGTLVFDENGIVLHWAKKPGTENYGFWRNRTGKVAERWTAAIKEGERRRDELLDTIAAKIEAGEVGDIVGLSKGMLGTRVPPMTAEDDGTSVKFRLTPHLHLLSATDQKEDESTGERQWEISC